jgi:hypothetical protein
MRPSLERLNKPASSERLTGYFVVASPSARMDRGGILFLRHGLFLFAWTAGSLAQDLQCQPRLLPRMLFGAQTHGLSLA